MNQKGDLSDIRKVIQEKSKNVTLQRLIYSIGIRHIGIENAKLISENVKKLTDLSISNGLGDEDTSAMFKIYQQINDKNSS